MTPRSFTALVAAALAVALLGAACAPQSSTSNSVSKFRGDQRAVAQAVEDLEAAANDSDEAKLCNQILSRALAGRIAAAGNGCQAGVKAAVKDTDSTGMTVEAVQVSGNRATARVKFETGKRDRRGTIALVREGGGWRIAGF